MIHANVFFLFDFRRITDRAALDHWITIKDNLLSWSEQLPIPNFILS